MHILLQNWKLIVSLGLIAVIAALGMYVKLLKSNIETLTAEKQTLQATLEVSQASVAGLQAAINEQNAAIDNLKTQSDARERSYADSLATARATSASAKKRAEQLMAAMSPQNVSKCDAANQLINGVIQNAK